MKKRIERREGENIESRIEQNKNMKWIQLESKENYLRAVYMHNLQKVDGVRYADLEEYFGFSKASVCNAVRALRDEGYVTIDKTYCIQLTEKGQNAAERIYQKYCFFRNLLIEAGVEPRQAELEACKLEHGISNGSLTNLINIYGDKVSESQ